jgi:4'-phosphopantetheinyl transferase
MRRLVPVWLPPPAEIVLSDDAVHIWSAPLELTPPSMSSLREALTTDELCRAESFRFERDRMHFIAGRGLLRVILGRYLNRKPAHLCFEYGPYGKPFLSASPGRDPISFNVCHSQGLALFAVTLGRQIGIDVEYLRTDFSWQDVAERFFSPQENADLRALPEREQREAFFSCWTRKEAYIKARGEGLSHALDEFDVSVDPKEPARLLTTRGDPREASRWSLRALTLASGYVGTVAVEGLDWRLACWQWREPSTTTQAGIEPSVPPVASDAGDDGQDFTQPQPGLNGLPVPVRSPPPVVTDE